MLQAKIESSERATETKAITNRTTTIYESPVTYTGKDFGLCEICWCCYGVSFETEASRPSKGGQQPPPSTGNRRKCITAGQKSMINGDSCASILFFILKYAVGVHGLRALLTVAWLWFLEFFFSRQKKTSESTSDFMRCIQCCIMVSVVCVCACVLYMKRTSNKTAAAAAATVLLRRNALCVGHVDKVNPSFTETRASKQYTQSE